MHDQKRTGVSGQDRVLAALGELIDALDRRVPHVERVGEMRIAREAAALREAAVTRIEELKRAESNRQTRVAELADAVMTDDGGPARKDERRSTTSAADVETAQPKH